MSEFDNIKVGDEVYIPGQYGAVGRIVSVTKTTPTTFTAGHTVFYKKNGYQKGGSRWSSYPAVHPTDTHRRRILDSQRLTRITGTHFNKLTSAQLEAICAILDQPQEPKAE